MPAFLALIFARATWSKVLGMLGGFVASRIGQIIIAFAVAWFWSGSREAERWRAREAAQIAEAQAAAAAQVAEWKTAAERIAQHANDLATQHARELRAQEDYLSNVITHKERSRVPSPKNLSADADGPVFLDPDYVELVRGFDAAGGPGADAPAAAGKLRQARRVAGPDRCAAVKIFALRNRGAASEANRRLVADWEFYNSVRAAFSAPED